jgi:beta-lactamase regulating signal transducer with metallopeptidase domain
MSARIIAEYLLVLGAKSSLFFIGAALITRGMRRRAAAARHLVWIGAIIGAALLPVVGAFAPAWNVRVLSTGAATAPSSYRSAEEARLAAATTPAAHQRVVPNDRIPSAPVAARTTSAAPGVPLAGGSSPIRERAWPNGVALTLVAVWVVGCAWLLFRIVLSVLSLSRLRRRATPVTDVAWQHALRSVTGTTRRIALLVSDDVDVPLTWGTIRPVILLPREAYEWSAPRRELVLRHESAHVDRYDVLTQLLARMVRALYWPNPLAWVADRSLRGECEHACDDAVLAAGVRPTRYAEELLSIASALSPRGVGLLAPGFASRRSLEVRLRALLDARSARRRATRLDAALTAASVLALAFPLAAMRPVERTTPVKQVRYAASPAIPFAPALVLGAAPSATSLVAIPSATVSPPSAQLQSLGSAVAELCSSDGGSHSNLTSDRDGTKTWEVHWSGRDCAVDLRAEGDIRFNDDVTDIASISRNGFFDLSIRQGDELTRVVVRAAGQGELDRRYTVNGTERPWNARAQEWFADVLLQLDRQTGFAVDLRFPKLLARGVPAVFDEVEKLGGDYVRGLYLQRLIERAQLSPSQVRQTLELAGRDMRSDYELTRILVSVSERYGLPDEDTRAVFLNAVNKVSSDYERNRALHALLARADLSPREASAVLQSASAIKSDYELARTLVVMTDKKLISPSSRSLYLDDVAKISSDYERSRVILGLLGSGKLSNDEVERVIGLASGIKSDYERARVLVAVGDAYDLGDQARDAYLKAARSISSDYERNRALAALRTR